MHYLFENLSKMTEVDVALNIKVIEVFDESIKAIDCNDEKTHHSGLLELASQTMHR